MENKITHQKRTGSIAIFLGAGIFGLFWIPLHFFAENGLAGLWTVSAINLAGLLMAIPAMIWSGETIRGNIKSLLIIGIGIGISNILYFAGIILSDVVRVIFLFYLLPLWATLFSWLLFKEAIGRIRIVALLIAIIGIWLLLGAGGWPIPHNIGDVFGLLSGMGWAFGLTMIRGTGDNQIGAFSTTAASMIFACIGAFILGLVLMHFAPNIQQAMPAKEILLPLLLPVCAFGILVLWPSIFGQLWGAQFVSATSAALLTMSEILVATLSTWYFGEPGLDLVAWIGACLVLCAILIDLAGSSKHASSL